MDFPRIQFAVFAATLLAIQILFLDKHTLTGQMVIGATALCLFWQLWWILPYTPLWPQEVKAATDHTPDRQPSIGSDHFPLLTRLSLNPTQGKQQQGLEACAEEHEWAEEIAGEKNASTDEVPQPGGNKTKDRT